MLRSELIEILRKTTRDCQCDGEVMIEFVRKIGEIDGVIQLEPDSVVMPIVCANEMLGWGQAITVLSVVAGD